MKIPNRNIIAAHKLDRSDISYRLFELSKNGRALEATQRIALTLSRLIPLASAVTYANPHSLRIVKQIEGNNLESFTYQRIDQLKGKIRNRIVVLVSDTLDNATNAYAQLLSEFPLKIYVVCFLR